MGQDIHSGAAKRIPKITVRLGDVAVTRERLVAGAGKEAVLKTGSDMERLLAGHVARVAILRGSERVTSRRQEEGGRKREIRTITAALTCEPYLS